MSFLKTFFLLYNCKIFVLLIDTFANYNIKVRLSNIFYLIYISNFLLNNSTSLF